MRFCKKCNVTLPNRIWIDGKRKNIAKRIYCLKCSPFGNHNTKQLHLDQLSSPVDRTCICTQCGKTYIYSRKKANSSIRCNSCYVKNRRRSLKESLIKMLGGKCVICNYNRCSASLDFHHTNPEEKEFQISGNSFSKERLVKEAKKCKLVCKNCHGEIEMGLITI